jgi:putative ABC transport system permease protein
MIRNYLTIAWRNMQRNKLHSLINISGLAVGIASFVCIILYVEDELKFDTWLETAETICQVNLNADFDGQEFYTGRTPPTVGPALAATFPEIESYTRIYRPADLVIRNGLDPQSRFFTESSVLAADSGFFSVFRLKFLKGNPETALLEPNTIVITEKTARKYFDDNDPLGRELYIDNVFLGAKKSPFTITGVVENLPSQSSLQFDFLTPMSTFPVVKQFSWSWMWLQVSTYVRFRDHTLLEAADIKRIEEKFPAMVKQLAGNRFDRDALIKKGGKWNLHLQPYTRVHLHSAGIGTVFRNVSDIKYVYVFSVIGLFIIFLACVNFMNLSTALAAKRAKEVGVRKVLGSAKRQLVKQFLTEALLFSFIATVLALILTIVMLPAFSALAGKEFGLRSLVSGHVPLLIPVLILMTGLLAGSYPAFYLVSFKPVDVLKGEQPRGPGLRDYIVRNVLVVFQFAVSTCLIICTLIVFSQLRFMQTKDLGLDKQNLIVIQNSQRLGTKEEAFRSELEKISEIKYASIATGYPTHENFGDGYVPLSSTPGEKLKPDLGLSSFVVDQHFVPALDIKIIDGRNFETGFNDSASVILNETAAKTIGWTKPVGSYIDYPGGNNRRFKVIGVVRDFNVNSLHTPVSPFALFHLTSKTYDLGTNFMLVKNTGDPEGTLEKLRAKWKAFVPAVPIDVAFLDSEFDILYETEKRVSGVFFVFTGLSVFVASLGLLGLAIYSTQRRTREIGIRKVLGASVQSLMTLLSKEFIRLVFISTLVAFPFAWWGMSKWLQEFAYRIEIRWWVFVVSASAALMLAFVTVCFHTMKAALANPVRNLRTE